MDADSRYFNLEGDGIAKGFTTTGCKVPLDVVELIMGLLASVGSFRALQQCSLVCKDFATICQKHIFTYIDLSNNGGFEGGNRTFPALASFKKALDSKPYLEGYAHVLDYCHNFDRHRQWPPVLRRLRHVQSLRILLVSEKHLSWRSSIISPSFKSSFLRLIRTNHITHLDLCGIPDLPTHIFALVPCLGALNMREITLDNDPPFVQESPPKLRALHLILNEDQLVHTLVAAQNAIVDLSSLKHLEIDMGGDPALMGVIRALLQQSEVLESLKLVGSLLNLDLRDNLVRYLPSKSLESLVSVELEIEFLEIDDDPYLNLTSELEKLSRRNVLENLIILIMVPMRITCNTETSRWSELDKVLSQPLGFPRLRYVEVNVDVSYFHESDREKEMEEKLAVVCDEAFPWLKENVQVEFVVSLEISPVDY